MKKLSVVLLVILAITLSGCASDQSMDPEMEYYDEYGYNDENNQLNDPEEIIEDGQNQGGDVTNDAQAPSLENRKIIYKADLVMAVVNPTEVYNSVLTSLESYQAYIENANITSDLYVVTIRVLSSEFDALVEDLKTSGELVSYQKTSEDITNTYSTFEARYEALQARHDRILELISEATNLSTILELEEERYEIEAELNNIGITLANYDSLVDYSTIDLTIKEAKEEIIVLPRTESPQVIITEISTSSINLEVYNNSEENITLQVDLYLNGEFVKEYEENMFSDSKTIVTFDELTSNKLYTIKVTALAENHRVSLVDTYKVDTEKTYTNQTTSTFIESVNVLVLIIQFIGIAISALLPFAVVISIIYFPLKIFVFNKRQKPEINQNNDKE